MYDHNIANINLYMYMYLCFHINDEVNVLPLLWQVRVVAVQVLQHGHCLTNLIQPAPTDQLLHR